MDTVLPTEPATKTSIALKSKVIAGWAGDKTGRVKKNAARDRAMLAAFEAGRTLEQLAQDYRLTEAWVRATLTAEMHRRLVSPEPFYREIRARMAMEDGASKTQTFKLFSARAKSAHGASRSLSSN
jgi:hypothetical protein